MVCCALTEFIADKITAAIALPAPATMHHAASRARGQNRALPTRQPEGRQATSTPTRGTKTGSILGFAGA
jgi:hypothetical protein